MRYFVDLEPCIGGFLRIEVVDQVMLQLGVRVEYLQDFIQPLFVTEVVQSAFAECQ